MLIAVAAMPWLAPVELQLAMLACLIVILVVLALALSDSTWKLTDHADLLPLLLGIAKEPQLLELYRRLSASLRDISIAVDPIYRDLAMARATQTERELHQLSQGRFVFTGTETWRMAYERLLRSQGLYLYRSIAFLKTPNYWQDEPGRQSMEVNFELANDGKLNIERIAIVPDHLWPQHERFPVEPVHFWLQAQHQHNINDRRASENPANGLPPIRSSACCPTPPGAVLARDERATTRTGRTLPGATPR